MQTTTHQTTHYSSAIRYKQPCERSTTTGLCMYGAAWKSGARKSGETKRERSVTDDGVYAVHFGRSGRQRVDD